MATDINYGTLDTIKKQKGMKTAGPAKSTTDIIRATFEQENPGDDTFETFLQKLLGFLRDPGNKLIRIEDTVFLTSRQPDGSVEIHISSNESPDAIAKNLQNGAKLLKSVGVNKVTGYSFNPIIQKIIERSGLPVQVSQITKVVGDEAVPAYHFELEL